MALSYDSDEVKRAAGLAWAAYCFVYSMVGVCLGCLGPAPSDSDYSVIRFFLTIVFCEGVFFAMYSWTFVGTDLEGLKQAAFLVEIALGGTFMWVMGFKLLLPGTPARRIIPPCAAAGLVFSALFVAAGLVFDGTTAAMVVFLVYFELAFACIIVAGIRLALKQTSGRVYLLVWSLLWACNWAAHLLFAGVPRLFVFTRACHMVFFLPMLWLLAKAVTLGQFPRVPSKAEAGAAEEKGQAAGA